MLRYWKRVGQHLQPVPCQIVHHLEGCGAAVDDDGLAFMAEIDRGAGDRTLLREVERLVLPEGPRGQRAGGMDRLGAATHLAHAALLGERRDVAPDRRLRSAGIFHCVLDRDDRPLVDRAYDDAMALPLVHWALPERRLNSIKPVSISF